jgi:hypothetical protein
LPEEGKSSLGDPVRRTDIYDLDSGPMSFLFPVDMDDIDGVDFDEAFTATPAKMPETGGHFRSIEKRAIF